MRWTASNIALLRTLSVDDACAHFRVGRNAILSARHQFGIGKRNGGRNGPPSAVDKPHHPPESRISCPTRKPDGRPFNALGGCML
jgi:hypothetical protein